MTCLPAYQPQLEQIRWGLLIAPQRGQVLRAACPIGQADALLLLPFAFEVFFFGTAITAFP